MIIRINDRHRPAPADEMQFLVQSQPKPRTWKVKRRTRQLFQLQYIPVKCTASFHIGDVYGHMIQLKNLMANRISETR